MKFNVKVAILVVVVLAVGAILAMPYINQNSDEKAPAGESAKTEEPAKRLQQSFEKGRPVFLEFFSHQCPACLEISPVIEQLQQEYSKDMEFIIVDVGTAGGSALAGQFGVQYIPAMFIMDGNENMILSEVGVQPKEKLESAISDAISASKK